jgi:hypothetical protein
MFSAAIDQDGDRYSFVRTFKGPQDALNQGKSKTLALANSRRVRGREGRGRRRRDRAARGGPPRRLRRDEPEQAIQGRRHPSGHRDLHRFTDDAKSELDGFANANMAAMSRRRPENISGRALELLRQPGMAELGPFVLAHPGVEAQLYRKIWNTVQRHWTAERWIRVNNNEKLAQFIQLNGLDLDQWGRPVIVNAVGAARRQHRAGRRSGHHR